MAKTFCQTCGAPSKLVNHGLYKYDTQTGKPIYFRRWVCPNKKEKIFTNWDDHHPVGENEHISTQ